MTSTLRQFDWRRLMFMGPVLAFVSQGRLFTRATAIAMRVMAGVMVLGGLVASVFAWVVLISGFTAVADWMTGILVLVILQVVIIVATYMVTHLLVIRARHVDALPEEQFTIIPLSSLLLRVTGELAAAVAVPIGVGIGLVVADVAGALLGMLIAVPIAAVALLFFYFLAEAVVVVVEIAKNSAAIRRLQEDHALASRAGPKAPVPEAAP